jgi:acid stress chaperone HdeB
MKGVRSNIMKPSIFVLAVALIAPATPAQPQGILDLSLLTCRQLLNADDDMQRLISSWLAGYFSASKNLSVVDFRYTERNSKVVGSYCRAHKSDTVMNVMVKNWR